MKERKNVPVKQPVEDQAQAVVFTPFIEAKKVNKKRVWKQSVECIDILDSR